MSTTELDQQTMPQQAPSPADRMLQYLGGFWIARAITAAANLGVADHLTNGPQSVEALAQATNSHAPSLYRLMRALCGAGVFNEVSPRVFASTELGDTLRSGVHGSLRSAFVTGIGDDHYDAWADITHSVQTGEIAFDHVFEQPIWKFYQANETNGRKFNQYMTDLTQVIDAAAMDAYREEFARFTHLVDVGGGHGSLISAVLRGSPAMRGTVYDLPHVVEGTRKNLSAAGLAGRCEAVGGDFFQSVPAGGDGYMMKFIIHDWEPERAKLILSNVRKSIRPDGRLLLLETVVPEGNDMHFSKLMDLNMLVMTGGRERTEKEYAELLAAGGFKLRRVVPTESVISIIEAEPA